MQVVFLGVNWPQYFSGYHNIVLQVPVDKTEYTNAELADMIDNEVTDMYDFFDEDELAVWDSFVAMLRAYPDEDDDMGEYPYAYFSLGNPHTVSTLGHQITFLD